MNATGIFPRLIGKKIFLQRDQLAFAELSRDFNPMHVDPVLARRLISGSQVVHGINILLTALEMLVAHEVEFDAIARVSCDFKVAINLEEEISFELVQCDDNHALVHVNLGSVTCTKLTVYFVGSFSRTEISPVASRQVIRTNELIAPLNLSIQDCGEFSARVEVWTASSSALLYPKLSQKLGEGFSHIFALLSYIVGMVCPGLNSIFVSLDVSLGESWCTEKYLGFHVGKFDERVNLVEMRIDEGVLRGVIKAFRRPEPVKQPSIQELAVQVSCNEFASLNSFVIGGSRGLGELMGKILVAGGSKVTLGFAVGKDDALCVQNEINAFRMAACHIEKFDIRDLAEMSMETSITEADAIFYFPTPVISKKINSVFNQEIYQKFLDYYVYAFATLCRRLEAMATKRIKVFYPSTVFIEDRPNGMTEYVMAKAAAELMIEDFNRSFKKVKILVVRLPRLKSDQTNSIFQLKSEQGCEHLLSVARAMMEL